MQAFQHITFDPQIMAGQACIRSMRITAALIVRLIAYGQTRKPPIPTQETQECLSGRQEEHG
jgi:hypothetical protein